MEPVATISASTWIVWALIGFIGGFMLGRSKKGGAATTVMNVIVGAIAAVVGGWVFCYLFGTGEQMQYISLIIAVATTAIGLWLLTLFTRKGPKTPIDPEA